jgi:hypothetical protein
MIGSMPEQAHPATGVGSAFLVAEAGGLRQQFGLTQECTKIGRSSQNDVRLPFTAVSRAHAVIVRTPMGFKISDGQSRNGVYVNDVRIMEKFLEEGDRIRIGEVTLSFTYRDPAGEDPIQKGETGSMTAIRTADTTESRAVRHAGARTQRRVVVARPAPAASPVMTAALAAIASGVVVAVLLRVNPPDPPPPVDIGTVRDELQSRLRQEATALHRRQDDKIENLVAFQRDEAEKLRVENDRLNQQLGRLTARIAELSAQLAAFHTRLAELAEREPKEAPPPAKPEAPQPFQPPSPFGPGGGDDDDDFIPPFPIPPIPPPMPPPGPPDPDGPGED